MQSGNGRFYSTVGDGNNISIKIDSNDKRMNGVRKNQLVFLWFRHITIYANVKLTK